MKKIIISSTVLMQAVRNVKKAISRSSALPVLDHVHVSVKRNLCTLTGGNLETYIQQTIECEAKEDFVFLIPCALLLDILSNIEESPVSIQYDPKLFTIELSTDYGKFKLTSADHEDYPKLPELGEEVSNFDLSTSALMGIISKSDFAMGYDELRPIMNGIYFDFDEQGLKTASTDAHKLVMVTDVPGDKQKFATLKPFLLPRYIVTILSDLLGSDGAGRVDIEYSPQFLVTKFARTVIHTRLIEGRYPNYQAVVPKNEQFIEVERLPLLSAVRQGLIVANRVTRQIRIAVNKDGIEIFGEDLDFSNEGSLRLSAKTNVESGWEIGFNGIFLTEILKRMEGTAVKLEVATPNRAVMVREKDAEFLLMPVMLNPRGETTTAPETPEKEEEDETEEKGEADVMVKEDSINKDR